MGAALAAVSAPLSNAFGLAEGLLFGAGLALLPIGLFILTVAVRKSVAPPVVYAIIAGNVLWVAASTVLAAKAVGATMLGTTFVLAQAAAVAVLTLLEKAGAARAPREPATTA